MNVSTNKYCYCVTPSSALLLSGNLSKTQQLATVLYWLTFITMNTHIPQAAAINTHWSSKCGLIQSPMQYADGYNISTFIYVLYLTTS